MGVISLLAAIPASQTGSRPKETIIYAATDSARLMVLFAKDVAEPVFLSLPPETNALEAAQDDEGEAPGVRDSLRREQARRA